MSTDWDDLVAELTRLRRGRGLTLQALAASVNVLAILGNAPVQEAHQALAGMIRGLGTDERVAALIKAYNLDEAGPATLTDRRSDLHGATGRDPKTLAGYEDEMIRELAARLLGRERREVSESQVVVLGQIEAGILRRILVTVAFPPDQEGNRFERTVEYENLSKLPSLPALVYQLPNDWQPQALVLGIHVTGDEKAEQYKFVASASSELLDLIFANNGGYVDAQDRQVWVHFRNPAPGALFTIHWHLS